MMMSDGKVRGVVHLIEGTKTFGQKGFRKRLVVLEQERGNFTNYLPLDFTRDACDKCDDLSLGDEIEVEFSLSGRRWQRDANSEVKYFLSAEASGFQLVSGGGGPTTKVTQSANDRFSEAVDDDEICRVHAFDVLRGRFIQMWIDTVGNQNDDVRIGTDDLLCHRPKENVRNHDGRSCPG